MCSNFRTRKGVVDPVTLAVLAAFGLGAVFGSWKPLNYFKKAPDTKQLTELQAKLETANKAATQAEKDKDAAVAKERADLAAQVKAAQHDALGAELALNRDKALSPESALGKRMIGRANLKLAMVVGKLPVEDQAEVLDWIDQLLSGKQAEIDAANAKLAKADADFKNLSAERDQIAAQIPVLTKKADEAEKVAAATQAKVTSATNTVKAQADKLFKSLQENSSLTASIEKGVMWIVGILVTLMFIIPGIVKHLEAGPVKTVLRAIAGYATAPLLFHDATKKIPDTTLPTPAV